MRERKWPGTAPAGRQMGGRAGRGCYATTPQTTNVHNVRAETQTNIEESKKKKHENKHG